MFECFSEGFNFRKEGKKKLLKRKALGEIDSDALTKRRKYNVEPSNDQSKKRKSNASVNLNTNKRAKNDVCNIF